MSSTPFPGDLSPFRTGFLRLALFIGGTWVDVPMTELEDAGVTIDRKASEAGRLSFALKDSTGKWSPRHPGSPYYGLIGRGTPVRVQVEHVAGQVRDRWLGEVVTWQPRWTKTGPKDARVDVEAAGTIRRLSQGQSPLRSPLFRAVTSIGSNLVAYWPMEDGSDAKQFTVTVGRKPIAVTGTPSAAAYSGFASSEPIPTLQDASFVASVPAYTPAATPVAQVRWVGYIPNGTADFTLVRAKCSGTLNYVELRYVASNDSFTIEGVRDDGTSAGVGTNWHIGVIKSRKQRFSVEMTQSGANISVAVNRYEVGATTGTFLTGSFTTATIGVITSVEFNPLRAAVGDVAIGHLTVEKAITALFDVSKSVLEGFAGERADSRVVRLCSENGVNVTTLAIRAGAGARLMGAQRTADLLALLRECEATDGGMLYEPRSTVDLEYRPGEALYSQNPVTIPYTDNLLLPFEPVEDDDGLRNTVTVTRAGGASATVQEPSGPLGTAAVGIYDEDVTLSLYADADAVQQAGWRVHVGTHDEARWPTIGLDLAHPVLRANTTLRDSILGLDLGSRLDVTSIPSWLPPFAVSQLVTGYAERITPHSHRIEYQCVPARPYRAAYYGAAADRYSGDGTVLATPGITTTTATTFTVTPPTGVRWTTVDGSYPIVINGEVMTVTNVTGNVFTVTRAVNGITKTHATSSAVTLADPCYYGL